jgi:hypothetical protein
MDDFRRSDCLCRLCGNLKLGQAGRNCVIAEDLYRICQTKAVALAVTRCPNYQAYSGPPRKF